MDFNIGHLTILIPVKWSRVARHHDEDKSLWLVGVITELPYVTHNIKSASLVDQACVQGWE